jgi:hypothetical protein
LSYKFNISDSFYNCTIIDKVSDKEIATFTDYRVASTSGLSTFIREFKKNKLFYISSELISTEDNLDEYYISKLSRAEKLSDKFITLDLETQGSSHTNAKGKESLAQSLVSISIYGKGISHQ